MTDVRPYRSYWKLKITLHFSLNELLVPLHELEFRLKCSDSASLSGAEFAFNNELDEMDRIGKSSQ
jgi:hypothetical protein